MAREKSWFVGFTKKHAGSTTITATTSRGGAGGRVGVVAQLANQLSVGANIGGIDPDQERDPPARATPLVFPKVKKTTTARWSSDHPPPNFQALFGSIQRPDVPLTEHLRALNCDQQPPSPMETLLPPRDDETSYVPAKTSTNQEFAKRVAELDITNDAASRALSKTTKPGDKAPCLTNMRKFWIALNDMAQYWDASADNYYISKVPTDPDRPGHEMFTKDVKRYKGRRTGNGSEMPDKYRADTANAFVEGVTGAFRCRVSPPFVANERFAPMMQIRHLEQPVRLTSVVTRLPPALEKPGAFLEGPVMGVLESNTIDFCSSLSASDPRRIRISERKSEHDLLREIAAMLMIAQQRSRENQGPVTQTEEAWYSTKARWGGGTGSKLPGLQQAEDEYNEIIHRMNADLESPKMELWETERLGALKNVKRARAIAQKWSTLKAKIPNLWSDKTSYMAVGKPPGSPYDQIFLVSCLFHHVSILKLTIHDAYTEYLTTGSMPKQTPAEEDWCSPKLERTEWYDLLDQEGRVEAFRCIWGVMEYLNRDKTTSNASEAGTVGGALSKAV
ncbi:hypothetical protein Q7P35_007956 [Cladosporium inversicolor]